MKRTLLALLSSMAPATLPQNANFIDEVTRPGGYVDVLYQTPEANDIQAATVGPQRDLSEWKKTPVANYIRELDEYAADTIDTRIKSGELTGVLLQHRIIPSASQESIEHVTSQIEFIQNIPGIDDFITDYNIVIAQPNQTINTDVPTLIIGNAIGYQVDVDINTPRGLVSTEATFVDHKSKVVTDFEGIGFVSTGHPNSLLFSATRTLLSDGLRPQTKSSDAEALQIAYTSLLEAATQYVAVEHGKQAGVPDIEQRVSSATDQYSVTVPYTGQMHDARTHIEKHGLVETLRDFRQDPLNYLNN